MGPIGTFLIALFLTVCAVVLLTGALYVIGATGTS